MSYVSEWFPFTLQELKVAFEAMDLTPDEAEAAASSLAHEIGHDSACRFAEFGGFLDPIAALSEDAAERVARVRKGHPPHSGLFWEPE